MVVLHNRRSSNASSVSTSRRESVSSTATATTAGSNAKGKRRGTKIGTLAKGRSAVRGNQPADDVNKRKPSLANIQEDEDTEEEDSAVSEGEAGKDTHPSSADEPSTTKGGSRHPRRSTPTTLRITDTNGKEVTVTNRMLAPNYKVDDVARFCEIFAAADYEQNGNLDIDQWTDLFQKIDAEISAQQARLIFMRLDDNQSGALSLGELIPVVFSTASRAQLRLIEQYAGVQCVRGAQAIEVPEFR